MEDAHTHILQYKDTGAAFFAVFDGHGGNVYICIFLQVVSLTIYTKVAM